MANILGVFLLILISFFLRFPLSLEKTIPMINSILTIAFGLSFVGIPVYLSIRCLDFLYYILAESMKGKKDWNWFPCMSRKLFYVITLLTLISIIMGKVAFSFIRWGELNLYLAYTIFLIFVATNIMSLVYFEIIAPRTVEDSIRAKLNGENLFTDKKNQLIIGEKPVGNLIINLQKFEFRNEYNHSLSVINEGDNFHIQNIYYNDTPLLKRLPFKPRKLNKSFEKIFEKARHYGLREESRVPFEIMWKEGYQPDEPLYFKESREEDGELVVNKAQVAQFLVDFFDVTKPRPKNDRWKFKIDFLREYVRKNFKFRPDNIGEKEVINEEIVIKKPTFSCAVNNFYKTK